MIEFFAIGTAVLREEHVPPPAADPGLMLALNDPPRQKPILSRRSPTTGVQSGSAHTGGE